jgi:GNAT superfamily N-acetyltransferase
MFQAAPPPAAVATALAALNILEREPERRLKLWENVRYMLKEIQGMGFKTPPTESAIIPIIIGDDLKTFRFAKMLEQEGVYVNPVVSPAVPPGMACLRTSYTATHSRQELDYALEKLRKIGTELGLIGPSAPGAPIDILAIGEEKSDQMNFLKLPWKIYTEDRNWVPPMITDVETIFDHKENIFYAHGEARAFLAYRGSEVAGRIVAAMDHRANRYHNERAGFFGFFEVDRDYRAAAALLDAARQWLSDRDMKIMRGPIAFSQLDGMGCLVEGFDYPPAIMMPYNPAYYPEFFEKYGLEKEKDFYAYWMDAREPFPERLEKLSEHAQKKDGIVIRHLNMSRFRQEMNTLMGILNDANSQEFGFTPLSDSDLHYFSTKLRPVIEKELVNFVEVKGKPVAFSMILPDYNEVLKRFDGRVGIADMLKFYFYSKQIKTLRFTLLAVRKAFQRRGLETLLYLESFRVAKARGYTGGELSWVREDNNLLNKGIKTIGGKRIKTYRVYQLKL